MHKIYSLSFMLCPFLLTACSTLPSSFTTENMMKTRPGMSSDEIIELYGEPKNIRTTTCGSKTDNPWRCTVWEYGEFPYDRATFYFSREYGAYILNNFDIDRD
jgi:hypothetical protein